MLDVLRRIDHPNFGLIYEPANLLLCGQSYGAATLRALRPYLWNVYLQNHRLDPAGPVSLPTYCRGEVRFQHLDLWSMDGIDWPSVVHGLDEVGYHGFVTIHQAQGIETTEAAGQFARRCAEFLRSLEPPSQPIR
jgi:sugar phosphate isomerase/epimerase